MIIKIHNRIENDRSDTKTLSISFTRSLNLTILLHSILNERMNTEVRIKRLRLQVNERKGTKDRKKERNNNIKVWERMGGGGPVVICVKY